MRRSILTRYDEWLKLAASARRRCIDAIAAVETTSDRIAGWDFRSWVSDAGPDEIVTARRTQGDALGAGLRELGLVDSWQYTAVVRARLLARELEGSAAAHVLQKLKRMEPRLLHRFVPGIAGSAELDTLFRQQANHVDLVVSWLRAARSSSAGAIDQILLDAFGDPLGPIAQRHGQTWSAAEQADEAAYRALLERMTRTDIEFYFRNQQGEDAMARADFWSQYVPRIRRTKSFLCGADRARLRPIAEGAPDPSYRQALARAGRVRTSGATAASAFVLWFDGLVAVEFSRTGNATYLYTRKSFEALGISVDDVSIEKEGALKDRQLGEQLVHNRGWQQVFEDRLRQYGVDRPPPSATTTRRRVARQS